MDDAWLTQTKGTINHYRPQIHKGTQPVRVLHGMLLHMFQHTNATFFQDLLKEIENGKIKNELRFIFAEESISAGKGKYRTPHVNNETRQIVLHETFLSYLWCCTYAIYNLYIEKIDKPRVNQESGRIVLIPNEDNIVEAKELFDYAKFLIVHFEEWDKDSRPNPEIYQAKFRDNVEQPNLFYTEAVKFILCHEYTHLKMHIDQMNDETTPSHYLQFEEEADNNAIDLIKKGISYASDELSIAHRTACELGVIIGILSMFFFTPITEAKIHPNLEDRLTNALERLSLKDNHEAWGIACIALEMWDEQFELGLKWTASLNSYKKQYYHIVDQIKARHN